MTKAYEAEIAELKERIAVLERYGGVPTAEAKENARLREALEMAAPDWLPETLSEIQECLTSGVQEFAIRLWRARKILEEVEREDAQEEAL